MANMKRAVGIGESGGNEITHGDGMGCKDSDSTILLIDTGQGTDCPGQPVP